MTELNKPIGLNPFCGPAVLAIMTGRSTDECARVISRLTGQSVIKGVQYNILLQAFVRLGWNPVSKPKVARTLFGILNSIVEMEGNYLIEVPGHVVIIQVKDKKIFFCDNHTKEPIPAENSARLMQQVTQLHLLVKIPAVEPVAPPLIQPPTEFRTHIAKPENIPETRRVVCRKCVRTFDKTALTLYQVTLRNEKGVSIYNIDHLCKECTGEVLEYLERLG